MGTHRFRRDLPRLPYWTPDMIIVERLRGVQQPQTQIAAIVADDGRALVGCWLPGQVHADGGTLADSYADLHDGSHDLVLGAGMSAPTLGASGWEMAGATAFDTGWVMTAGTDTVLVVVSAPSAHTGRVIGRRTSGSNELLQLLPQHPNGAIYVISDASGNNINATLPTDADRHSMGLRGATPWRDGADAGSALGSHASAVPLAIGALYGSTLDDYNSPLTGTVGAVVAVSGTLSAAAAAQVEAVMLGTLP